MLDGKQMYWPHLHVIWGSFEMQTPNNESKFFILPTVDILYVPVLLHSDLFHFHNLGLFGISYRFGSYL